MCCLRQNPAIGQTDGNNKMRAIPAASNANCRQPAMSQCNKQFRALKEQRETQERLLTMIEPELDRPIGVCGFRQIRQRRRLIRDAVKLLEQVWSPESLYKNRQSSE